MIEQTGLVEQLCRPISDMERRSPQEVFDIMCNRLKYGPLARPDSPVKGSEAMTDLAEAVQSWRDHFEPNGKRIRLDGADKKGICIMLDRVLAALPNTSVGQGD